MSASTSLPSSIKIVDTMPSLISFLDDLTSALTIPTCTSTLYLSISPRNITTPSILIIHWIPPHLHGAAQNNPTYLLDLSTLSAKTLVNTHSSQRSLTIMQFTHAPSPGQAFEADIPEYISLRNLFESPHISKVVFDVRDISHFLYTECHISLAGVKDLQLMELAVRDVGKDNLGDLAKCVELHSPLSSALKKEWEAKRVALLTIESQPCEQRPMRQDTMQYYAGEVNMLPGIYRVLCTKLRTEKLSFWRNEIETTTKNRIEASQSPIYNIVEKNRAWGSWTEEYLEVASESWNKDMFNRAGGSEEAEADRFEEVLEIMRERRVLDETEFANKRRSG
ncbi:hypothetical protein BELL_0077g00130 [Botrytis elliptica]|uniref:3'-5' exonuclease domain-containing protein n=1 Tax=Botrytis elliptica TaxID=278938 RepID=A0A4Z1KA68_9HELO|nr:hypothetical protein EAE99_009035 [Botrytis elliptica]TGO78143.1 hypothetical protein BELL_0077g00130 [Botrytis elliptica]